MTEGQRILTSVCFMFNNDSTNCVHWLGLNIPGPQGVNYPAVILLNDTLNGFGITWNRGLLVWEVLTDHRCTVYYDVRSGEIPFDVRSDDDRLKHTQARTHTHAVCTHTRLHKHANDKTTQQLF